MKLLARLLSGAGFAPQRDAGSGPAGAPARPRRMAHPVLPGGVVVIPLEESWRADPVPAGTGDLACSGCGASLGFDAEDEPDGEGQGLPICGECNRARNFDADVEYLETLE